MDQRNAKRGGPVCNIKEWGRNAVLYTLTAFKREKKF